ncbi:hypothetical protein RJ639_028164 [Escallonia herrerae]|uniref:Uncharacterized protein n=1 Tax=Escallonia herrerae TaxID=1293975 RepID=A0AA88X7Z9_9ASTE|nr:hypothetical protein RJ639_028164 [Escallonia herrerae]
MDLRHFTGYGVTGADLSYSSSLPTVPLIPTRLIESGKFEFRNSLNSPFSTHFDSETHVAFSDSQEQYSSTEYFSATSPSSLENSSSFQQLSPSLDCYQDSPLDCSGGTFLQNAHSGHSIKHALQELETVLMGTDEEEINRRSPSIAENEPSQTPRQNSTAWSQESPGTSYVIQSQSSYVAKQSQSDAGVILQEIEKFMHHQNNNYGRGEDLSKN